MSDPAPNDLDRLRQTVLNRLESLERAGVKTLPKPRTDEHWLLDLVAGSTSNANSKDSPAAMRVPSRFDLKPTSAAVPAAPLLSPRSPVSPAVPSTPEPAMPRRAPVPATPGTQPPQSRPERIAALETLSCQVAQCTLCPILAKTRTQTVFGVGNPEARVAFFGEAPGADEDRQGEPFVGRAGQLLTKIIEACGFKRDDVYILNVLRCRPPENRNPAEEEVENCRRWFESTLGVIRPEYIVCVGTVPTKALFPDALAIGKMRGKFYEWRGSKVLCTYHPSYLLRNPDAKKFVWDDMKLLLADMGLEVPRIAT